MVQVHAKNYETFSIFVKVMQRNLWPFSEHGVVCLTSDELHSLSLETS